MPAARVDSSLSRGARSADAAPGPSAPRSIRLTAAWTGAGAALVCAVVAIAAVAVCWLPAAGETGSARSALHAGVLTFLAALHGGITVDGLSADFVPLGMTLLVAAVSWRAGAGLARAADDVEDLTLRSLAEAAAVQAGTFAAVCGVAAGFATLGTSSVSVVPAVLAGLILFGGTGGIAFVRATALGSEIGSRTPDWVGPSLRAAAAGVAVYLAAGAALVIGSLVVHHQQVEALSRQVGGGWSGAPVLLLGALAAPNAVVAAASYLAGPGFALGSGSGVGLSSTVHGTVPAFPLLGAVPSGPATTPVWLLAGATPIAAGLCLARVARADAESWRLRLRNAAAAAAVAVVAGIALAWLGGGAIGSGRLRAFGASPWQFGLALGAGLAVVSGAALGALAGVAWWRSRDDELPGVMRATLTAVTSMVTRDDPGDADEDGKLAG
ncbi:MAG: DUF6350 family protein [Jatrophihabitans sp.]|uniref:cell division protein PerM n=1 Tax=Jatrophihabitans sp. TaxID=1932789 RepID=UPI003914A038